MGKSVCEQLIWQYFTAGEEKHRVYEQPLSHGAPSVLCALSTGGWGGP